MPCGWIVAAALFRASMESVRLFDLIQCKVGEGNLRLGISNLGDVEETEGLTKN